MRIDATNPNALPIEWKRAKGCEVWDTKGKKYLDFTASIFVMNCGHGAIAQAIKDQVDKVIHSYTYDTPIKTKFLRKLKHFLPHHIDKIYLASAGSEVTSWAEKLMRKYKLRPMIVHFHGAFHGKIGRNEHEIVLPFPKKYGDWHKAERVLLENQENIAGVMIETYQGWSGRFLPMDYVYELDNWCRERDIPICYDEVQSGFYRTGKKFGFEWYAVKPDLICLGKAMAGGMPMSALAGRGKYFVFPDMSSTHSGQALCCAGGLETLNIFEKMFKTSYKKRADRFISLAKGLQKKYKEHITECHGFGFVAGMIFKSKGMADAVTIQSMKYGLLLVNTGKHSIKLGPPVIISDKEITKGFAILEKSLEEVISATRN